MNDVAISNDPNVQTLRVQLEKRMDAFAEALPAHISPEQFKAVLIRAAMGDPGLLVADRVSFFEAALAAAIDGLLPDKREGAMVIYNTKIKGRNGEKDQWIKKVQWMPMIRGVFTKVYNTGLVKSATVGIVYGGDQFRAWVDDEGEHLFHEEGEEQDRGVVRRIYAQVVMKAGGVFVDTMRVEDIEKVRQASKSPETGPWKDWYEEMAKKTVFRHLSKRLPIAREVAAVLDRDNFLYDMSGGPMRDVSPVRQSLTSRLDSLVSPRVTNSAPTPDHGKSAGADTPDSASGGSSAEDPSSSADTPFETGSDDGGFPGDQPSAADRARAAGRAARQKKMSRKSMAAEFKADEQLLAAWNEGFDEGASE